MTTEMTEMTEMTETTETTRGAEYRRAYYDGFFEATIAAFYMRECGFSKDAICSHLARHLELDLKKWRDGDGCEEPPVVNLKAVGVCPTCGRRFR